MMNWTLKLDTVAGPDEDIARLRSLAFLGPTAGVALYDEFDREASQLRLWVDSELGAAIRILHPPHRQFLTWSGGNMSLPDAPSVCDLTRLVANPKFAQYRLARFLLPRALLEVGALGYKAAAGATERPGMLRWVRRLGFEVTGPPCCYATPGRSPITSTPVVADVAVHEASWAIACHNSVREMRRLGLSSISDFRLEWR